MRAQLFLHPRLQFEPVAVGAFAVGQQPAVLVDDAHRIGRHPRHRGGDQIDHRRDLAVAHLPAAREADHDRSRGGGVFANEHRFFTRGEVDAGGLDAVDLHDRQHQLTLARCPHMLCLERAAGAHRQIFDLAAGAAIRAGQRAIGGGEHAGPVEIVLGHGERAGLVVDPVGDCCLVERGDDTGPLAVA